MGKRGAIQRYSEIFLVIDTTGHFLLCQVGRVRYEAAPYLHAAESLSDGIVAPLAAA